MKRRLVIFLCLIPFVAIAGVAVWILAVKQETTQLEKERAATEQAAQPAAEPAPAPPAAPAPVEIETRRLDELRGRLEEVQAAAAQPPTGSADNFIQRTNERIQEIQGQLDNLNKDSQAVNQNAEALKQQDAAASGGQQLSLENQIQEVDTQILELQVQLQNAQHTQPAAPQTAHEIGPDQANPPAPPNPAADTQALNAQIAQLKTRRDQLEAQVRAQGAAAHTAGAIATGEQLAEQGQIKDQRADLEQQLADLRGDLEYWQEQKNGNNPGSQAARVQQLEQQIREQEQRVNEVKRLTEPPESNTLIQDNYVHDLLASGEPHYDGVQIDGGLSNIKIIHNTIINPNTQTSAVMIDNYFGPISGMTVDNNRLIGGGFTIYCSGQFNNNPLTAVSVTNNRISMGYYGYTDFNRCSPTFTGNVDDKTGLPLK